MSDDFHLLPRCLNGAIAGVVGVSSVYPLDLVKTRLQTQPIGPHGERMYSSMIDAFLKIYRLEGFSNMYRGLAVNVVWVAPEIALKLSSNDFFRYIFKQENEPMSILRQVLAGACSGAVTIMLTNPMEFLKIQLQDEGRVLEQMKKDTKHKLTGRAVLFRAVRKSGIRGIYKGLTACALRDISFGIIYFPTFSIIYDLGPRSKFDGEPTSYWSFLSGIIAGGAASLLVTPFDVVKTRLQTMQRGKGDIVYKGIIDCFKKTYRNEGMAAFFKGGACRIIVISPLFGITQMVYYFGLAEYIFHMKSQTIVR